MKRIVSILLILVMLINSLTVAAAPVIDTTDYNDVTTATVNFSYEDLVALLGEEVAQEFLHAGRFNLFASGDTQVLYIPVEDMENYYGVSLSTGEPFYDWVITELTIGGLAEFAGLKSWQGLAIGALVALINQAAEGRRKAIDNIFKDIAINGGRGMIITMTANPGGYPAATISFSTWR